MSQLIRLKQRKRRYTRKTAVLAVGLMVASLSVVVAVVAQGQGQTVTPAQAASGLYRAQQAWLQRITTRATVDGQSDTLAEYAKKCDEATGITVPGFNCNAGTKVPGQGNVPATNPPTTHCDQPNVLNGQCDPGSKFQVLPGGNADAVAVAHCRKVGLPIDGSMYNDIAVIQYNKKNGALCFYQALTNLPGDKVPPPIDGEGPWKPQDPAHWESPQVTEGIGCTGCHDNGGFIRSKYLAQLTQPPHVLPNTSAGFDNLNTPVRYVGRDYATNRSWSIQAKPGANDTDQPACNTCHRLAVPNRKAFGIINGTAAHFANVATAKSQDSKNPHSQSSPIWMRPGQNTYKAAAEASATEFHKCAVGFFNSGFKTPPPGCVITPLGVPWEGETWSAADIAEILQLIQIPLRYETSSADDIAGILELIQMPLRYETSSADGAAEILQLIQMPLR